MKQSGDWCIDEFVVDKASAMIFNIREKHSRYITPGTYKRLTRAGETIMSNTPAELSDSEGFVFAASRGDILISGLGMGLVVWEVLKHKGVRSITVIEKEADVITLVGPDFADEARVEIVHCGIFNWKPVKLYDVAWHDIWDGISAGNLEEMDTLLEKFEKFVDRQFMWCEDLCRLEEVRSAY